MYVYYWALKSKLFIRIKLSKNTNPLYYTHTLCTGSYGGYWTSVYYDVNVTSKTSLKPKCFQNVSNLTGLLYQLVD
jgi:hypothetical protein